MKRAGSGGNSSQSSTSDSEEDFLLDMWMGSDSEFYLLHVLHSTFISCTNFYSKNSVQTFLHNGQTNLSLHGHYDCPILVPYIAHCKEGRWLRG